MAESTQTQVQQVAVVAPVSISFWQTTYGILLKRLFFQALAAVSLVMYNQLVNNTIDWNAIRYALATQAIYVVLTFSRDMADPKLPNSTEAVVIKQPEVVEPDQTEETKMQDF